MERDITDLFRNKKYHELDAQEKSELAELVESEEEFEQMRNQATTKYDKMNLNEFKSVMDDPFGISKDFNTIIGNEISQKPSQITSHMVNVYKKLIEYDSDDE